jgi:tryptophanyl-tRNA synthetase
MLADLHSITVFQDPKQLRENIIETAAVFLACGLDPKKNVIFCQSSVAGHSELAWIFNCVARIGWLNRMTQFKEKAGSNKEKASVGLYSYPTLMAADILLYKATHVPVGEDQKQHLELCRDIAVKFNNDFNCKDFFTLPEPIITKEVARIMSLKDGTKKMSKSDESEASRINLTDTEEDIVQKIRKAKTDNELIPYTESKLADRPEARNLINIFSILSGTTIEKTLKELSGKNFSELKNRLSEVLIKEIVPIGKKIKEFKKDTDAIKRILKSGSEKANIESQKTIKEVHKIVGLSLS